MLKEHEAAKWLGMRKIDAVDWLPADRSVVENSRNPGRAEMFHTAFGTFSSFS